MTDLESLHRAILEQPAEDTPRRMWADALVEAGGSHGRAEWVRYGVDHPQDRAVCLCCSPHNRPVCPVCLVCQVCGDLANHTLDVLRRPDGETHYVLHRGFVEELRVPQAGFLKHADDLLWHPRQKRPVPPTAQPVATATLDNLDPNLSEIERARTWHVPVWEFWGRNVLDLFRAEWPGVAFETADRLGLVRTLPRPRIEVEASTPVRVGDQIAADENGRAVAVKRNHPASAHLHILGTAVRGTAPPV